MGTNQIYIPIVANSGSHQLFQDRLGCQIEGNVASQMQWLPEDKVGQWPIRWREVETIRGVYEWPKLYDANAEALAGHETIITIKCCPEWSWLWDDIGSPPAPEYYDDLKRFIQAVQARYHPNAIEYFNEPDVRKGEGIPDFFGAWVGDGENWYQGGQRYGQATAAIYPDLGGKLLAGALMMHSNSLEFLCGALDAGLQCDAISYHCYIYGPAQYNRPLEIAAQINAMTDWGSRLVITETSVLGGVDTLELRAWQAEYLHNLLRYHLDAGIELVNWYAMNSGWKNNDLVRDGQPTPVYEVWRNNV